MIIKPIKISIPALFGLRITLSAKDLRPVVIALFGQIDWTAVEAEIGKMVGTGLAPQVVAWLKGYFASEIQTAN